MGVPKCKTTAITRENNLISSRNEHTHEVFPGRSDARLLVQKMKQDTKIQQVPVSSIIIANGLQSVSEEKAVQLALPCRSAINRALNRQKVNDRPTLPPIVDRHFEVPKQHEDFCVFDSANQKFKIMKAMGGNSNPSRKKYRELNEKVKNICNIFDKDSILTYLYSLAQLSHS